MELRAVAASSAPLQLDQQPVGPPTRSTATATDPSATPTQSTRQQPWRGSIWWRSSLGAGLARDQAGDPCGVLGEADEWKSKPRPATSTQRWHHSAPPGTARPSTILDGTLASAPERSSRWSGDRRGQLDHRHPYVLSSSHSYLYSYGFKLLQRRSSRPLRRTY